MNTYEGSQAGMLGTGYVGSASANPPNILKDAQPERATSLTDIVGLSDQLSAAVEDVHSAWYGFQHGGESPTARDRNAEARSGNRIDNLQMEMHGQINGLRQLAAEIRSRA